MWFSQWIWVALVAGDLLPSCQGSRDAPSSDDDALDGPPAGPIEDPQLCAPQMPATSRNMFPPYSRTLSTPPQGHEKMCHAFDNFVQSSKSMQNVLKVRGGRLLPAGLSEEALKQAVLEADEQVQATLKDEAALKAKAAEGKLATPREEGEAQGKRLVSRTDFLDSIADMTLLVSLQDDALQMKRFMAVTSPEEQYVLGYQRKFLPDAVRAKTYLNYARVGGSLISAAIGLDAAIGGGACLAYATHLMGTAGDNLTQILLHSSSSGSSKSSTIAQGAQYLSNIIKVSLETAVLGAGTVIAKPLADIAGLPDSVTQDLRKLASLSYSTYSLSEAASRGLDAPSPKPTAYTLYRAFKGYAVQAATEKFVLPGRSAQLASFPDVDLGDLFVAVGATGSILDRLANSLMEESPDAKVYYMWNGAPLPIYAEGYDRTRFARTHKLAGDWFQTPDLLNSGSFTVTAKQCEEASNSKTCRCMLQLGDGRGWIASDDIHALYERDGSCVISGPQARPSNEEVVEALEALPHCQAAQIEQSTRRYRAGALLVSCVAVGATLLFGPLTLFVSVPAAAAIAALSGGVASGGAAAGSAVATTVGAVAGSTAGAAAGTAVHVGGSAIAGQLATGASALQGVAAASSLVVSSGAAATALSLSPSLLFLVTAEGLAEGISDVSTETTRQSRLFFMLMALAHWELTVFSKAARDCDLVGKRCPRGQVCMTSGAFFQTGHYGREGVCVTKPSAQVENFGECLTHHDCVSGFCHYSPQKESARQRFADRYSEWYTFTAESDPDYGTLGQIKDFVGLGYYNAETRAARQYMRAFFARMVKRDQQSTTGIVKEEVKAWDKFGFGDAMTGICVQPCDLLDPGCVKISDLHTFGYIPYSDFYASVKAGANHPKRFAPRL